MCEFHRNCSLQFETVGLKDVSGAVVYRDEIPVQYCDLTMNSAIVLEQDSIEKFVF